MTTPEGKVKDKVKRILKRCGVYYHMPVQNGMGEPTLDFVGCVRGRYFAIETKAPGKSLPPGSYSPSRRWKRQAAMFSSCHATTIWPFLNRHFYC